MSGADPPPEAKAPGRGGDNEGDVIAAVRGPAARGEALLAVTAEAPAAEETTKVTSSLLSADSVGRHAEATPPLEARRGRRDNRSPSVTAAADETCASSGWDDASRASPELAAAAPPSGAQPRGPPLPADGGDGRKKPRGSLTYRAIWEMQKQLRTGKSLRGKQLTKEKADELRRSLRFAKAVTQVATQPIVEAVRSEASGVKKHMTDLAMGSVCLAPGTTPHDEYRANLLQIRQLQSRNSYLKEAST